MVGPMSDVILYGVLPSSYVRTAVMTCAEKGVSYELVIQPPNSPEQLAMHPFGKVPAMKHGDLALYETTAICRYVNQVFDGPALIPSDAADAAVMEQWLSVVNSYLYNRMVKHYALVYIFAPRDKGPDRATVEAGLDDMKSSMAMIDKAYEGKDWLVGDALSLADLFIAPIIRTVSAFPEGKEALAACKNATRVYQAMSARPSFAAAHPASG